MSFLNNMGPVSEKVGVIIALQGFYLEEVSVLNKSPLAITELVEVGATKMPLPVLLMEGNS